MTRLRDAGIDYDSIDYVVTPPSREKLAELVRKMDRPARDLLRTGEKEYRDLGMADTGVDDEQILDALASHPVLLQRPILEYGRFAGLARPAETVDDLVAAWGIANG